MCACMPKVEREWEGSDVGGARGWWWCVCPTTPPGGKICKTNLAREVNLDGLDADILRARGHAGRCFSGN